MGFEACSVGNSCLVLQTSQKFMAGEVISSISEFSTIILLTVFHQITLFIFEFVSIDIVQVVNLDQRNFLLQSLTTDQSNENEWPLNVHP